jgi:death-on-curing family protein
MTGCWPSMAVRRDQGLLVSALARPCQLAAYDQPDLCSLAAAYATGIVCSHPFIAGNTRAAFIAAYVFLARNGLRVSASDASATHSTLALGRRRHDQSSVRRLAAGVDASRRLYVPQEDAARATMDSN